MKVKEAEKKVRECEVALLNLRELRIRKENEAEAARDHLRVLRKDIPGMYGAFAMGEITKKELAEFSEAMSSAEEVIAALPLINVGLKERENAIRRELNAALKVVRLADAERRYARALDTIRTSYSRDVESDLWLLGTELGKRDEAGAVIKAAKDAWVRRPLSEAE